jgi:zinc metalloprotease ZmpB
VPRLSPSSDGVLSCFGTTRKNALRRTIGRPANPKRRCSLVPVHCCRYRPSTRRSGRDGHYVASEIIFSLTWRNIEDLPWIAIIDVESLSVLYLRAFVDNVTGLVFKEDPITTNNRPLPNATEAQLNPLRSSALLPDLVPPAAGVYSLIGDRVQVVDVELPAVPPPTSPAGTNFDFGARTNNFAAVNAYYHCDRFFQLVEELGFDLDTYFGNYALDIPSRIMR